MEYDDGDSDEDRLEGDGDGAAPPSFAEVLHGLQHPPPPAAAPHHPGKNNNKANDDAAAAAARRLRLAAVAGAVVDVVIAGGSGSATPPTAARVCARAVTALEGTLLAVAASESGAAVDNSNSSSNNGNTEKNQRALLELLHAVLPHVRPAALLAAALPAASRVLRGLVAVTASDDDSGDAILSGTCRVAADLLERLPAAADAAAVERLVAGTLLAALADDRSRPRARRAAHRGLLRVLLPHNNNKQRRMHPAIAETISAHGRAALVRATPSGDNCNSNSNNNDLESLRHCWLPLLERAAWRLHYRPLSAAVLECLAALLLSLRQQEPSDFVLAAARVRPSTPQVETAGALLAVVQVLLRPPGEETGTPHGSPQQEQQEQRDALASELAPRVLACLLQASPQRLLMARADEAERARTACGQVALAAGRRLLVGSGGSSNSNNSTLMACRLLPLAVQLVLQLARPAVRSDDVAAVAEPLLVELLQFFRTDLPRLWLSSPTAATATMTASAAIRKALRDLLQTTQQHVLLEPAFAATWSVSLKCIVVLLQQVEPVLLSQQQQQKDNDDDDDDHQVADCVEHLVGLHRSSSSSGGSNHNHNNKLVEDALSTLIQGVGLEKCWGWIQWQSPASAAVASSKKNKKVAEGGGGGGVSKDRAWILSTMRSAASTAQAVPPRLAFFREAVLGLARTVDQRAAAGRHLDHRRAVVVDLWSLFPCFCRSPSDLAQTLPSLTATCCFALDDRRYPELLTIICQGFTTLVKELEENGSLELDNSSDDVAAVAAAAVKLLPVMFKFVSDTHAAKSAAKNDSAHDAMEVEEQQKSSGKKDSDNTMDNFQKLQSVTTAISSLARLAPVEFLHGLFKKLMHRLLEEVQAESGDTERICSLLTLSQALVASKVLDESSIVFLYRALKPLIRNDEHGPRVQKRAYKVLAEICAQHHSFVAEPERLKELSTLLTGTIMTSQISARSMRLKCMNLIVDGLDLDDGDTNTLKEIYKVTPEVLLCLKDSNAKSREAAYQLLVALASKGDAEIIEFLQVVIAALGAKTPHMRSAVVMALSRIVYETAMDNWYLRSQLPSLLQTVLVLIDEDSREVVKSVVGFIRICVAVIPPEQLEPLLPKLLGTLLRSNQTKSRFRAKIKIILKKLVKHFGYEALLPHVPDCEKRLLTHMRKLDEREKRRRRAQKGDSVSQARNFDEMFEMDEEDSDDGRTFMTGVTGFTRRTGQDISSAGRSVTSKRSRLTAGGSVVSGKLKAASTPKIRLPDETDGEVLDMLGSKMAKRVHFAGNDNDDSDSDDETIEFNEEGKIIVRDEDSDDEKEEDTTTSQHGSNKRRRLSMLEAAKVARNEKSNKKRQNQKSPGYGAAYKSKKAGGDMKKKGQKYEPYAYVPLDGRAYSKKNRKNAVEQMTSVVRKGKRKR